MSNFSMRPFFDITGRRQHDHKSFKILFVHSRIWELQSKNKSDTITSFHATSHCGEP